MEAAESESNLRSNYSESAGTRDVSEDIVDLHINYINLVRIYKLGVVWTLPGTPMM